MCATQVFCLSMRPRRVPAFMHVFCCSVVSKVLGDSLKALRGETTGFLLELQQRGAALAEELTAVRLQLDQSSQAALTMQTELRSLAKQCRAMEQASSLPHTIAPSRHPDLT